MTLIENGSGVDGTAFQGVIVVGATDCSDNRAGFSNFASLGDIMARADNILSTWNAGPIIQETVDTR